MKQKQALAPQTRDHILKAAWDEQEKIILLHSIIGRPHYKSYRLACHY